ncbi:MAG: hypothetical protein J2P54_24835, partial [Bradyrhizobiaceae bacterium]|nr:hypothetical protein [Bradyrhizobiaceae bacterium]
KQERLAGRRRSAIAAPARPNQRVGQHERRVNRLALCQPLEYVFVRLIVGVRTDLTLESPPKASELCRLPR